MKANSIVLFSFLTVVFSAWAGPTTGGVNWLDPLSYAKPVFMPLTVPDEVSCPNKYYVDMTNGSGALCSQAAPCKNVSDVSGKPGTAGGPAYIYLKGNGRLVLTGSLYGSLGSEVVIKPADSSIVNFTADGSGSPGGAAIYLDSASVHHLIIDGGASLQFKAHGNGGNDNGYVVNINSSHITIARTEMTQDHGGGPILGAALGNGASITDVRFVNNEIHQSGGSTPYGVYIGGGSGCYTDTTHFDHLYFYNNIIRDVCGRPIQLEPRNSSMNDDTVIEGNVIRNSGKNTCGSGWGVSDAVGLADACGASFNNVWIRNNLFFDIAGAFGDGSGSNHYFTNNTVYSYGNGTPATTSSHAVGCYDSTCTGVIENNILLLPHNGVFPVNRGSFSTSRNICESGYTCGDNAIHGSASNVFLSTDSASTDFLKLMSTSLAVDSGVDTSARGVVTDYLQVSRPQGPSYDIGAFELASYVSPPPPPPPPPSSDTQAPQASITAPVNGSSVPRNTQITISASATDNVGVTKVEFYVNGSLKCTDTAAAYTCAWRVPKPSGKTYNLQVKAYDAAGNVGSSQVVRVNSK